MFLLYCNIFLTCLSRFESTEWSIIYQQESGLAEYYHREIMTRHMSLKLETGMNEMKQVLFIGRMKI